jgi:hypothetical protein
VQDDDGCCNALHIGLFLSTLSEFAMMMSDILNFKTKGVLDISMARLC